MGSLGISDPSSEYSIVEETSRLGRKIRIIVIGCGASAINFAHEVDTSSLDLELVCYDKNPSIGGTWYENKYPGCGCDIPSINYQFSWAPSPHWSSLYVERNLCSGTIGQSTDVSVATRAPQRSYTISSRLRRTMDL
jgi:cation diffusion facilitator CzcD-associated flavoprotein CzcO